MRIALLLFSVAAISAISKTWAAGIYFFAFAAFYYFLNRKLLRSRAGLAAVIAIEALPLLFWKFALHQGALVIPALGISFFSFHAISFTADRRKRLQEPLPAFTDYCLYLLYFPKFFAGPIDRFDSFSKELATAKFFDISILKEAFFLIGFGAFKKFLLVPELSPLSKMYFHGVRDPGVTGPETVLSLYAFALEFFLDFSAYTDLARGISLLFGIRLPENFFAPFLATNPQDFWRRWHVTLSQWFRDYVYYPLFFATKHLNFSLFLTFLLMGIWHGFTSTFVLLGVFWGLLMVAYSLMQPWILRFRTGLSPQGSLVFHGVSVFLMFHLTVIAFLLFRAPASEDALFALKSLGRWSESEVAVLIFSRLCFVALPVAFISYLRKGRYLHELSWSKIAAIAGVTFYYVFLVSYFTAHRANSDIRFLYFQF